MSNDISGTITAAAETRTLYLVADATIPGGPLPGTWVHQSVLNARQIVASA